MLKSNFIYVTVAVGIVLLTATPFFYVWWEHTEWVQEMVSEDISEFREHDIDWLDFSINDDPETSRREIVEVILRLNNVFSVGSREEQYDYRDVMYDVISIVVNDPENVEALNAAVIDAYIAQQNLYTTTNVFTNNTLYAMRFTI